MKYAISWSLAFSLIIKSVAWAQPAPSALADKDKGGNGGHAYVCFKDESKKIVTKVLSYDYWEQPQETDIPSQLSLGAPNLPVADKIRIALNRLHRLDPTRADRYAKSAEETLKKLDQLLIEGDLDFTTGGGAQIRPIPPCYQVQFAYQIKTPGLFQSRFTIRRSLYSSALATNDTRAGIILHEVLQEDTLRFGLPNSHAARRLNYFMASGVIETMSVAQYVRFLRDEKFYSNDEVPLYTDISPSLIYASEWGKNEWIISADFKPIKVESQSLRTTLSAGDIIRLEGTELRQHVEKVAFRSLNPSQVVVGDQVYAIGSNANSDTKRPTIWTSLSANGEVREFAAAEPIRTRICGTELTLKASPAKVVLNPVNQEHPFLGGVPEQDVELECKTGEPVALAAEQPFIFRPDGRLLFGALKYPATVTIAPLDFPLVLQQIEIRQDFNYTDAGLTEITLDRPVCRPLDSDTGRECVSGKAYVMRKDFSNDETVHEILLHKDRSHVQKIRTVAEPRIEELPILFTSNQHANDRAMGLVCSNLGSGTSNKILSTATFSKKTRVWDSIFREARNASTGSVITSILCATRVGPFSWDLTPWKLP